MKALKKPLLLILAGLALTLGLLGIKSCSNNSAIAVTTENVVRKTIVETVSANGKIQPEVQLKISSDVSGEIVELHVKEGDHVKKGDLLVKIKPEIYQSALERASAAVNSSGTNIESSKANLTQVKAQFANAEAAFQRSKKLFDQGAISKAEYESALASFASSKAQVESAEENVKAAMFNQSSAQASLREAQENLNKTSIYAPVNGTVSKLSKEKGERVVGTSMMEGSEIMILANLNEMEVSVDVNENDIVRVHLNDTADIQVDAYMDEQFKGIVTEIANSANTSGMMADQVTNFTVKIRVLQDSYKQLLDPANPNVSPFRPGMSATVDIHTKTANNVLTLPIQSVTTRMDSTETKKDDNTEAQPNNNEKEKKTEKSKPQECVFVYSDGKVSLRLVKTGIQDNTAIEIIEGLKENEEVVNGPYSAVSKILKDGMEVKKTDKLEIVNSWKKE